MTERRRFVDDAHRGLFSMTDLCARYGISRKTGYKWLDRYDAQGRDGLQDRSHAPQACPHQIAEEVARAICDGRRTHPSWGPRKLLRWRRGWLCPRSAPRATSWRAKVWSRSECADRGIGIPASWPPSPSSPTICGPRISRGISGRATGATAIR